MNLSSDKQWLKKWVNLSLWKQEIKRSQTYYKEKSTYDSNIFRIKQRVEAITCNSIYKCRTLKVTVLNIL